MDVPRSKKDQAGEHNDFVDVGSCRMLDQQVYLMIMLAEGKTNMVIFMFFLMLVRLSSVEVETKK